MSHASFHCTCLYSQSRFFNSHKVIKTGDILLEFGYWRYLKQSSRECCIYIQTEKMSICSFVATLGAKCKEYMRHLSFCVRHISFNLIFSSSRYFAENDRILIWKSWIKYSHAVHILYPFFWYLGQVLYI